jgi:hypothetical protein
MGICLRRKNILGSFPKERGRWKDIDSVVGSGLSERVVGCGLWK